MLEIIDHIGIAVPDIQAALKFWSEALRIPLAHEEVVAAQKVKTAFLPVGQTNIELLEPLDGDGPIAKALESRGPGVHHLCFAVPDVAAALAHLKEQGVRLIDETPRPGAHGKLVAFIHPKSTGGILIELAQPAK